MDTVANTRNSPRKRRQATAGAILMACVAVALPVLAVAAPETGYGSESYWINDFLSGAGLGIDAELRETRMPGILGLFLVETVIALTLSAAIAFHPVRRRNKTEITDLLLPRLFLLYTLIGMAIGFLVLQHGYFIGFVVFGIGGLLRFRSTFEDKSDTAEVILATILGLCVGLNLPFIALLITISAWGIIWVTGALTGYELTLRCVSEEELDEQLRLVRVRARELGWKVLSVDHSFSKPEGRVLFQADRRHGLGGVRNELSKLLGPSVKNWRLSS